MGAIQSSRITPAACQGVRADSAMAPGAFVFASVRVTNPRPSAKTMIQGKGTAKKNMATKAATAMNQARPSPR